jgi:TRAP-type uncharacterized transport system substrate-binding protein
MRSAIALHDYARVRRARTRAAVAMGAVVSMWLAAAGIGVVRAQERPWQPPHTFSQERALRARLNEDTLILATSHPTASYFAIGHDIAAALASKGEPRILPLVSQGGIDNLRDLLFLRGVDMAIVPANALAHAARTFGPRFLPRIAYIARLRNEEVHLLAARGIESMAALRGKKVAMPQEDGNARFAVEDLFGRLGIEIVPVRRSAAEAIERVRSGDVAAALLVGSKPLPALIGLPRDGSLRLLSLPFSPALEDGYAPAAFRADDYPGLIPAGLVVDTVAIGAVLVGNVDPDTDGSAERIARFVPAFFTLLSERSAFSDNARWSDVNLAATLPGWPRVAAAEEWLGKARELQTLSLQKRFEQFLTESRPPGSPDLSPAQRKKLFDEFVSWTRKSVSKSDGPASR